MKGITNSQREQRNPKDKDWKMIVGFGTRKNYEHWYLIIPWTFTCKTLDKPL